MRYQDIIEGVTFKGKQKQQSLKRSDIRVGIEYEFKAYYDGAEIDYYEFLTLYEQDMIDIDHIQRIEKEHNNQVEVITNAMPIEVALKHIKKMFTYFNDSDNGLSLRTINSSGMHISISSSKYETYGINFLKFSLLMASNHFNKLFPIRQYVDNYDTHINNVLEEFHSDLPFDKMIPKLEQHFNNKVVMKDSNVNKYVGIKLSDYIKFDGRIELRFFGGTGYEHRYDTIVTELARSIHILGIAYGNEYDDVYKKELYKRYTNLKDMSQSLSLGDRLLSVKRFSMLSKNDKKAFQDVYKQLKNGEQPYNLEIQEYMKAIKQLFPDKIEQYLDVEYLKKLPPLSLLNRLYKSGLTDYVYLFMKDDHSIATIIGAYLDKTNDYYKVYDVFDDHELDIYAQYHIDDIEELSGLSSKMLPSSMVYFTDDVVPFQLPDHVLELFERKVFSSRMNDRIEKLINDSINEMKEQVGDTVMPMEDYAYLTKLVGRYDEYVKIITDLVDEARDNVEYDEESDYLDVLEQSVS